MNDIPEPGRTPLPSDFPLGSPESRAAARALAEARFLPPPDLITRFVKPLLDAEGNHVYGGQRCDSVRASVDYGGQTTFYDRNPGETVENFERRVIASHPHGRFPRAITLWPVEPAV